MRPIASSTSQRIRLGNPPLPAVRLQTPIDVRARKNLVTVGIGHAAVSLGEGIGALTIGVENSHKLSARGLGDGARVSVPGAPGTEDRHAQIAVRVGLNHRRTSVTATARYPWRS